MRANTKTYLVAGFLMLIITAIAGLLLLMGQWHIAGLVMMTTIGVSYVATEGNTH